MVRGFEEGTGNQSVMKSDTFEHFSRIKDVV